MRKPVVGETLYSLNIGNAARNTEQKLTPVKVMKVGRKYFTVSPEKYKDAKHFHIKYFIEDWRQCSDYQATSKLYESEKDWADEEERIKISRMLSDLFKYSYKDCGISLKTLRKINQLIKEDKINEQKPK